ncbi:unnamed protein product, partial [Meganyctiphanes norvegica]
LISYKRSLYNEEVKMAKKSNKRRNTWPGVQQISTQEHPDDWTMPQATIDDGNSDRLCMSVKDFLINMKQLILYKTENIRDKIANVRDKIENVRVKITSTIKLLQVKVSPIIKYIPLVVSITTLVLTLTDVATDAHSAYGICILPCRCWSNYKEGASECRAPFDVCRSAVVNGKRPDNYCLYNDDDTDRTDETCKRMEAWLPPDACRCYWHTNEHCITPAGTCYAMGPNGSTGEEYCNNGANSRSACDALPTWQNPEQNAFQLRHPYWCSLTTTFIIGPSILSNAILFISLVYNSNYKAYFR